MQIAWSRALPRRPVRLVEMEKRHGNVRVSELAILAQAAASVEPGCEIIEIGTFDGRTTLNLAVNAPASAPVFTLDLPAKHETKFTIEASDRVMIDKPQSGERIRACRRALAPYAGRITQLFGDSATFDWSAHHGRAGLVFVDGSHAYEYARQDSETAFALVRPGGVVLWHDYGVWPGVTQALEEIEAKRHLGLVNIRGTSLVFWRAPDAAGQGS
jgi:predicted O-methyltransferase YrrM